MADRSRGGLFDEAFLARLQQLHLVAKRLTTRGGRGARRSRRLGDGLEFADHRSYAAGDDIRFIDWPYYARMEKLLLRLFHERSEADVVILLDVSASMAPGGASEKFDCARRIAAALAFVAMGGLERVIVQPFSDELHTPFRTGRNRGQILEVLDFLVALEPAGRTDLRRCVGRLVGQGDRASTVLLLSDLLDCGEDLSDSLVRLRGRGHDTTVLHVCSPLDASPPLGGAMLLRQAETGQTMALNVTDAVRESCRQRWRRFRVGLERTTLARGATYVAAETDVSVERFVLRILRQAGVLAG
jgi:uncharacterized protein (DUF58 family)